MAIVTEITASPTIQSGEGEVVTGRFVTRTAANRVKITLSNGEEITATDVHPVWVPSTATWTPAGELIPGTQLDTLHGPAEVTSVQPLSEVRSVYNIEVHRHHVYRVGDVGVLVHNAYTEIHWSSPNVRTVANKLRDGASEIHVRNRMEAEEIFLGRYVGEGYVNTTGWGIPSVKQHGKLGTYHWDVEFGDVSVILKDKRVLKGHYDDGKLHNYTPHLQIHTFQGPIVRILFDA